MLNSDLPHSAVTSLHNPCRRFLTVSYSGQSSPHRPLHHTCRTLLVHVHSYNRPAKNLLQHLRCGQPLAHPRSHSLGLSAADIALNDQRRRLKQPQTLSVYPLQQSGCFLLASLQQSGRLLLASLMIEEAEEVRVAAGMSLDRSRCFKAPLYPVREANLWFGH